MTISSGRPMALVFPLLLVGFLATTTARSAPSDPVLDIHSDLTNATPILAAREKPARFSSYSDRLEFIHANMSPVLQGHVIRADELFRSESNRLDNPLTSRFRLMPVVKTSLDGDGANSSLVADFDADIELPNLEHRWRVYLRSRSPNTLPGIDNTESERATRLGVSALAKRFDIEADAGVRLRLLPEAFAQLKWEPRWTGGLWVFRPGQRLFAETGDGVGTLTSFGAHRWCGPGMNRYVQSVSAARRAQRTEGWEFEQTFKAGYVEEILEGNPLWTRLIGDRDIARGQNLRFSLFGHSEDVTTLDSCRLGMVIRRPCRRKWIYLQATPELQWDRDNYWRTGVALKVGLDMLFWGTVER
jgi:hypothetical protein